MKKENLVNYVKSKNQTLPEDRVGKFNIIFKDHFGADIEYEKVFQHVSNILPDHFLDLIDMVYVGEFNFMINREVNASYMDGALYISNIQDNKQDLLDDVVHEIAHALEEKYAQEIYSDRLIEQNFISKRERLERIIKYYGFDTSSYDFFDTSYNKDFDEFLYKEVGYDKLRSLSIGLCLAPYSMTSLREYFARGFEEYYLGNRNYLKKICPYIINKIVFLENNEEGDYETHY